MIDTDKYEGHTEGSWEGILSGYFTIEQLDKTDKVLMQDAPLLLAEVKRLRGQLKEANDVIHYALEMSSDDDSTRVFEDYLEVIE
jgi:hypothetical protein